MMPRVLAWLGMVASVILIVGVPLQLAGMLRGPITQLMWMPMLAFEVPGGLWLLVKSVPSPPLRAHRGDHAFDVVALHVTEERDANR